MTRPIIRGSEAEAYFMRNRINKSVVGIYGKPHESNLTKLLRIARRPDPKHLK